jgi:hypothetical protein
VAQLFSKDIQILIFFIHFYLGILHGANDLLLIKNTNDSKTEHKTTIYILVVLSITIILFDPNRCLAPFLVSAFHFGDQQGLYLILKFQNPINFLSFYLRNRYTLLLFFFHANEVEEIVTEIIRFKLPIITSTKF